MSVRDIIPWRRKKSEALASRDYVGDTFSRLHQEMNSLFENFFSDAGMDKWSPSAVSFTPKVDVVETEDAIKVSAELPGLSEKDIEVTLDDDGLVLKGEKRTEKEENKGGYHRVERGYGAFHRRVALPVNVDHAKVEAKFSKGVLNVTLQKNENVKGKNITINKN